MNKISDFSKDCANEFPLHGVYIYRSRNSGKELIICDHEIDPVLEALEPDESGWTGLALEYHCNESWKDSYWLVPDRKIALAQLKTGMSTCEEKIDNAKLGKLVEFFQQTIDKDHEIEIKYEFGGQ